MAYVPDTADWVLNSFNINSITKGKGEVIPLQARCGPEGG